MKGRKGVVIGADHSHGGSRRDPRSVRNLKIALVLTAGYMFAEAIGGWWTNSLALIADAGHMLTDVGALSLTLGAIWFAAKPANPRKTYGYYRLEILAAFINGVALVLLSVWVIYEAYERSSGNPVILGKGLTIVAAGGLAVNICAAFLLHGAHSHDLNMRGAWLHVMGDLFGSLAALSAGVLIVVFGWVWADAAASVIISLIIIYSSWKLIRESVNVLLEGTPSHINLAAVEESIRNLNGVLDVHDLHVWTIASGIEALSVHVVYPESRSQNELLRGVRETISEKFGIDHLTVQMETESAGSDHPCFSGANCFEAPSK